MKKLFILMLLFFMSFSLSVKAGNIYVFGDEINMSVLTSTIEDSLDVFWSTLRDTIYVGNDAANKSGVILGIASDNDQSTITWNTNDGVVFDGMNHVMTLADTVVFSAEAVGTWPAEADTSSILIWGGFITGFDTAGNQLVNFIGTWIASGSINAWGGMFTDDFTMGWNGTAILSTSDTDEDLTIDPNGSGDIILIGELILLPSADQTRANDSTITADSTYVRVVGDGGAVLLDTIPAIEDGSADGQIIFIQGTHDTNTVQIADNVNVQLAGGVAFTMGKGDILQLIWDAGDSDWYEVSRSDN